MNKLANTTVRIIHIDERTLEEKVQAIKEKYSRLPYTEQNIEYMNNKIKFLEIEEADKKYERNEILRKEWERIRESK